MTHRTLSPSGKILLAHIREIPELRGEEFPDEAIAAVYAFDAWAQAFKHEIATEVVAQLRAANAGK